MKSSVGLEDLPVEILQNLTLLLEPDDVRSGVFGASTYLRDVFSDEVYWKLRCRRQYPARWMELCGSLQTQTGYSQPSASEWREKFLRHHRKVKTLVSNQLSTRSLTPWTVFNQHHHFWGTTTVSFCHSGRMVATGGDSPNVVSLWDVLDNAAPAFPLCQAVFHTDRVESLRSQGNLLSSASRDKTIAISDLSFGLKRPPVQVLRSKSEITSHEWRGDQVVTGSDDNLCEIFDLRTNSDVMRNISFSDTVDVIPSKRRQCRTLQPKFLDDHRIILLGKQRPNPSIKIHDLRNSKFVAEIEVPTHNLTNPATESTPKTEIQIDEGSLWYGADRQLMQFNSSTLELAVDHSNLLKNDGSLFAFHRANGVLFTVTERLQKNEDLLSGSFCVQAYATGREKLWEQTFPICGQKRVVIDFSEPACAFVIATDESTSLLTRKNN
ncbi:hypothetical protein BV898_07341 [Hypsibius exemplaris]|uniref:F-box/WD repeat-containing protein 9 n=1 Tax=Hypsibius exemplaris TaxID=2072580 RepID=A0A1W0WTP4_HYPEX|nr:hypothetical protein BV898_07341 [Hypsibius exemplaris]